MVNLIVLLVISSLITQVIYCTSKCVNLDISVIQRVEHEGFHREVQWMIETRAPSQIDLEKNFNFLMQLDMSPGMFVNPDQLAELNRTGKLAVVINGQVDVEIAAHEAKPHTVYVFLNSSHINNVSVSLPIHLCYQRSQITGGFGKVPLSKPSLLVSCNNIKEEICDKGVVVQAPCNFKTTNKCIWKNVSYEALFEEIDLYVPIGDLDDYPLVSVVSLLLGCAGCIYILSILSTKSL